MIAAVSELVLLFGFKPAIKEMLLRSGIGVESAKAKLKKTGAATLMDGNPVTHNEAKGQFEIALGNEKALLQYRRTDDSITFFTLRSRKLQGAAAWENN